MAAKINFYGRIHKKKKLRKRPTKHIVVGITQIPKQSFKMINEVMASTVNKEGER